MAVRKPAPDTIGNTGGITPLGPESATSENVFTVGWGATGGNVTGDFVVVGPRDVVVFAVVRVVATGAVVTGTVASVAGGPVVGGSVFDVHVGMHTCACAWLAAASVSARKPVATVKSATTRRVFIGSLR